MATPGLITPNFDEAVEFKDMGSGVYKARITGHEVKTSQAGNTYIQWTWTVFGAEGNFAHANGRDLTQRTMTSGKGAGILRSLLGAVGAEVKSGESFDPSSLYGKEALLTVRVGRTMPDGSISNYPDVVSVKPITQ